MAASLAVEGARAAEKSNVVCGWPKDAGRGRWEGSLIPLRRGLHSSASSRWPSLHHHYSQILWNPSPWRYILQRCCGELHTHTVPMGRQGGATDADFSSSLLLVLRDFKQWWEQKHVAYHLQWLCPIQDKCIHTFVYSASFGVQLLEKGKFVKWLRRSPQLCLRLSDSRD